MSGHDGIVVDVTVGEGYEPPARVREALAEVARALAEDELLAEDEVSGYGFDAGALTQPQIGSLGVFSTPKITTFSRTSDAMICVSKCSGGYSGGACGSSYCIIDG